MIETKSANHRVPVGMEYPDGIFSGVVPALPKSGPIVGTIPNRPLTYLACPYSHQLSEIEELRYRRATEATAWLIEKLGWNVFSPITHSHPLATIGRLRHDWGFWKKIDTQYLECSERIVILELDGWRQSTGVQAELQIARDMGLEVLYLRPNASKQGSYDLAPYPMDELASPKTIVGKLIEESPSERAHREFQKDPYETKGCPETWAGTPEAKNIAEALAKERLIQKARCAGQIVNENAFDVTSPSRPTPVPDGMDNPKDLIGVTKPPLRLIPAAALLYLAKAWSTGRRNTGPTIGGRRPSGIPFTLRRPCGTFWPPLTARILTRNPASRTPPTQWPAWGLSSTPNRLARSATTGQRPEPSQG